MMKCIPLEKENSQRILVVSRITLDINNTCIQSDILRGAVKSKPGVEIMYIYIPECVRILFLMCSLREVSSQGKDRCPHESEAAPFIIVPQTTGTTCRESSWHILFLLGVTGFHVKKPLRLVLPLGPCLSWLLGVTFPKAFKYEWQRVAQVQIPTTFRRAP